MAGIVAALKFVICFSSFRIPPQVGFLSICTPFDETSVDLIMEHNYDIIKIASCSFNDWPLLEKIAQQNKPVIASDAGSSLEEIDQVLSFLTHR